MIDSIIQKDEEEERWDTWAAIVTLTYQVLFFLAILAMILLHEFKWKPSYTIKPGIDLLVDTLAWKNEQCDKYF